MEIQGFQACMYLVLEEMGVVPSILELSVRSSAKLQFQVTDQEFKSESRVSIGRPGDLNSGSKSFSSRRSDQTPIDGTMEGVCELL
jgi:hypothetical protein